MIWWLKQICAVLPVLVYLMKINKKHYFQQAPVYVLRFILYFLSVYYFFFFFFLF